MADTDLHRLADTYGVATSWTGYGGEDIKVSDATLRTVLEALGALQGGETPDAALRRHREEVGRRKLAPTTVVRRTGTEGTGPHRIPVAVPAGGRVVLSTEEGQTLELPVIDDGSAVRLPADLPLGYHELSLVGDDGVLERAHLILVPEHAPSPRRGWGWMLQLYALRSAGSWGVGDIEDLRTLTRWSAGQGADFIVCNPLHAAAPSGSQQPSPYYPSSRRYWNPSYLRVEQVPEYATSPPSVRDQIDALAAQRRADNTEDRIDRDSMWAAKRTALELLWDIEHTPARRAALDAFRTAEGEPLAQFALWCALADVHGPDWTTWPEEVSHPSATGIADARAQHADRIAFHEWLQFLTDEQLAATQAAARHEGMALGIVHDLAVGVNPSGADGWALQDHLATGVTVGAPPDDFNQQGQDWAQPPLLPNRLQETGYRVVRDLVRRLLRHAGGVRIDHILGYFRLFWVPDGGPGEGTYVRYPADDLLGVLVLEAHRAGAVIIGEDLGVVAPGVRESMRDRRMLGSRLLYFSYGDDGRRLPAAAYEPHALASITTHDLPTAMGWWRDEAVRVQIELGLLADGTGAEEAFARKRDEQRSMEQLLRDEGLLTEEPTDTERLIAMHAFLGRCGSALVAASVPDAVGDIRQPNMPGTVDEYPNWRLPVAVTGPPDEDQDGTSTPITLEQFCAHPLVRRVVDAIGASRTPTPRRDS